MKLGSLEMQARWITASQPATASANAAVSRRSPFSEVSFGLRFGRVSSPKYWMSNTTTS